MATTRIYIVAPKTGGAKRLVRAHHPSRALHHVAEAAFTVEVASQDDLVELIGEGVVVENAGETAGAEPHLVG